MRRFWLPACSSKQTLMTKDTPTSFSPGSITCFFSPKLGGTPGTSFSRGCSVNLREGVAASVYPSKKSQIILNGKSLEIPAVRYVIDTLAPEPVELRFETSLRLGFGFGVSAACCLSGALGLARRYDLPLTRAELGMIAHQAEVLNKSGLGDVAAQLCGGVAYRRCLNNPLDTQQVNILPSRLYYRAMGELDTATVLGSPRRMQVIAEAGEQAVQWLKQRIQQPPLSMGELLARSLIFAQKIELISDRAVRETIAGALAAGGQATMIMLGQGVLATLPAGDPALWTECGIDEQGARWI